MSVWGSRGGGGGERRGEKTLSGKVTVNVSLFLGYSVDSYWVTESEKDWQQVTENIR